MGSARSAIQPQTVHKRHPSHLSSHTLGDRSSMAVECTPERALFWTIALAVTGGTFAVAALSAFISTLLAFLLLRRRLQNVGISRSIVKGFSSEESRTGSECADVFGSDRNFSPR
uniref:Transmembrane protein n=1 Tax=Steinernema glaseri TaxID=37863 RepID=A0A1I7YWD4_9BILA